MFFLTVQQMFEVQIIIVSRGDLGTYEGRVFVHESGEK